MTGLQQRIVPGRDLTEDYYMTRFKTLCARRDRVDAEILGAIRNARGHGISWSKISRALGFKSRQAAAQWYGRRNGGANHDR